MKKYCFVLLALLPLTALAYPVVVTKNIDKGVKVDVTTSDVSYDFGAATLTNYGTVTAECKLRFINGPEAPRVRRVSVAPNQKKDVSVRFNREILKLRVEVDCKAQ